MAQHIRRTERKQLTEKEVTNLAAGRKRADGTELPGGGRLIVRAKTTARNGTVRDFLFRYWDAHGSERALLIGRHGDGKDRRKLTLKDARAEAWKLSELLKEGKDPQFQREMQRQANREAERAARESIEREARKGTLSDLLASYVAHLRAQGQTSAADTEKTLSRHVLKPFPELAARRARDITSEDVSNVLARMIAQGIERRTNIVRSMLRAAYAYGAGLDNDPVRKAEALKAGDSSAAKLFAITANPVADIRRVGEYDRALNRTLSDAELREYIHAVDNLPVAIGGALKTALFLGGQRMSQLLRSTWSDYDADERLLRLEDGKGGGEVREHVLPVTDRVASILEALKAKAKDGEPYIFSTRGGSRPIDLSTLSNAVSQIGKAKRKENERDDKERDGDEEPYSAVDIRRTVETRLAALGVSKEHRAQLLSHGRTQGVQDRHYDRHDYVPEKAAALAKWDAHVTQVLEGKAQKAIRARFSKRASA